MSRRINANEYDRIKSLVAEKGQLEQDRRREKLKVLSDERVSRWPNTLQAMRKQKETAFLERKAKREAELRLIDRQEDEKRARERREKIEYASKTIYRATDKMKQLKSAEILVNCVAGRNRQIKLNQRIKEEEEKWNLQFLEMDKQRMEQMADREHREFAERKALARRIAQTQKDQLKEVQDRYLEQLREEKREGLAIAERARVQEQEDLQKLRDRRTRARENAEGITRANAQLKEHRARQLELEAEEDRKTKEYADRKIELNERQKLQAQRIEAMKQKKRQDMIDEGVRRLANMAVNDEQRLQNQAAEARAAEDERNRIRDEKRVAFAESIRISRARQLERRREEKEQKLQKEQRFSKLWREHNLELERQDLEEQRSELRAAKEHQEYLRIQAHEKRMRDLEEKRADIDAADNLKQNIQMEEDEFRRIADAKVREVISEGNDPFPLLKCIAEVKQEKLLPAV